MVDEWETSPQKPCIFFSSFKIETSLQIQHLKYTKQKSSNYKVVGFHLEKILMQKILWKTKFYCTKLACNDKTCPMFENLKTRGACTKMHAINS